MQCRSRPDTGLVATTLAETGRERDHKQATRERQWRHHGTGGKHGDFEGRQGAAAGGAAQCEERQELVRKLEDAARE